MRLLEVIRQWFGSGSRPEPALHLVDDPPPDRDEPPRSPSSRYPMAWWQPKGPRVLWAPRVVGAGGLVDRDLYEHLVSIVREPDLELPRLSSVVQRAMRLVREPGVDLAELADVVRADTAITTQLLRTANSALYRGISEVRTLEQALARVGLRAAGNVILSQSVRRIATHGIGPEATLGQGLWNRSVASATVCATLARRCRLPEDEAYLLGLLHDVGALAIFWVLQEYAGAHGRRIARELFDRLSVDWHEHIGLRLADRWDLPAPLPEIIADHHRPSQDDDPLDARRQLVQFSDVVCALLRYAPYEPYEFFELPCVRALGITDGEADCEMLAALPDRIEEQVNALWP